MTTLQKLDPKYYPPLLEELKKNLTDSIVAYYFVLNHIQWCEKDTRLNFSILCPNADWRRGSFVVLIDGLAVPNIIYGTMYAFEENLEEFGNCLFETQLIDWKRVVKLTAIPKRCVPAVKSVMSAKGFTDIVNFSEVCQLNYIPTDEVKNLLIPACPENFKIAPLTLENLNTLCDNWKYYQPQFRAVVVKMIECNASFGIFWNDPNEGETLAAMVLQAEYGGLGLLSTVPEYRRKGLAALALAHLIQELRRIGITPFSLNATENQASSALFAKFGFKKSAGLYQWIKPVKI